LRLVTEAHRRADDAVIADCLELGLDDRPAVLLLDSEGEYLTGLVGTASRRRSFPPEAAERHTAPFGVMREHRHANGTGSPWFSAFVAARS
jgi:hypothetical protein